MIDLFYIRRVRENTRELQLTGVKTLVRTKQETTARTKQLQRYVGDDKLLIKDAMGTRLC